jgi:transposase InsO family protein
MEKIYYSTNGYWKGMGAIKKLAAKAKVSEYEAYKWLSKQEIWQIYLAPPKKITRPSFNIATPNEMHQADILYLPHDKGYKYALTIIDAASRYKEAEPLKTKKASEVTTAIEKIYARSPLNYPNIFQVDRGREFMGATQDLLAKHKTKVNRGKEHRDQAFVERFNRTLSERLFAYQYSKEMSEHERNREWVERLPEVIAALNNENTRLINKKPRLAIKQKSIKPIKKKYEEEEEDIPPGVKVRYLYQPGEAEGTDERKRATDPIWSLEIYDIESKMEKNPSIYYLKDGPERCFVKEELMVVPDDTIPY